MLICSEGWKIIFALTIFSGDSIGTNQTSGAAVDMGVKITNKESGVRSNYRMKGGWRVRILLSHQRISGDSVQKVGNYISLAKIHQEFIQTNQT